MPVRTVGILSTGDMGAAIGSVLTHAGLDVATSLAGPSELAKLRASEAGVPCAAAFLGLGTVPDRPRCLSATERPGTGGDLAEQKRERPPRADSKRFGSTAVKEPKAEQQAAFGALAAAAITDAVEAATATDAVPTGPTKADLAKAEAKAAEEEAARTSMAPSSSTTRCGCTCARSVA